MNHIHCDRVWRSSHKQNLSMLCFEECDVGARQLQKVSGPDYSVTRVESQAIEPAIDRRYLWQPD